MELVAAVEDLYLLESGPVAPARARQVVELVVAVEDLLASEPM